MSTTGESPTRHGRHAKGTAGITFRVSASTKADLIDLAKRDERTLSDFLRIHFTKLARRSRAARRTPRAT